jgi:NAD(P)-dependent dehydrogenase (short-subunit alcohol dehydrogenase family)
VNSDALEMIAGDPRCAPPMVDKRWGASATRGHRGRGLYLVSPASAWVTGKILEVDGGAVTSTMPFRIPGGLAG